MIQSRQGTNFINKSENGKWNTDWTIFFVDFSNAADYWMFPYESIDFERDIEDAWDSVKPLYEELHTYVRRKLRELYGPEKINSAAPLPSHVLGTTSGFLEVFIVFMDL